MDEMYIAYSWLAVSAAALAGFWLHLHYRRKDRQIGQNAEVERLEATVQALQADLDAIAGDLHERVGQLHERVDFTERMLTAPPQARVPAGKPIEPRIPTPV